MFQGLTCFCYSKCPCLLQSHLPPTSSKEVELSEPTEVALVAASPIVMAGLFAGTRYGPETHKNCHVHHFQIWFLVNIVIFFIFTLCSLFLVNLVIFACLCYRRTQHRPRWDRTSGCTIGAKIILFILNGKNVERHFNILTVRRYHIPIPI